MVNDIYTKNNGYFDNCFTIFTLNSMEYFYSHKLYVFYAEKSPFLRILDDFIYFLCKTKRQLVTYILAVHPFVLENIPLTFWFHGAILNH